MGRKRRYTIEEIELAVLKAFKERNGKDMKVQELASSLHIHKATMRKYIKQLINNGMLLIPGGKDGYHLSDGTSNDAPSLTHTILWIAGIIIANERISNTAIEVKALPDVKRALSSLPEVERVKLMRGLRLMGSLVNAVEIEEGFN